MYVRKRKFSLYPNSSTPELDQPQHDRNTACVIARQYSSASLVSLRLQRRKDKCYARPEKRCYFDVLSSHSFKFPYVCQ
jgi:hypothetical protein